MLVFILRKLAPEFLGKCQLVFSEKERAVKPEKELRDHGDMSSKLQLTN